MAGWLWTTTTCWKLNCTHRQTGSSGQRCLGERPTACRLLSYLSPNCRLQIGPPTVVSPEKLNVAAVPVKLSNSVADGNIRADRMESLCIFSAGFAAFFEAFTKWAILGVGTILQQSLGWRPKGQLATHHLFLGHCCYCPTAQLMAPRPSAGCTFALLKIVRESCAAPVSDWETMLLQQMRIPPPPLESCIAASTALGLLPFLAFPALPTRAASPTAGY